jgi:hypothetical protein
MSRGFCLLPMQMRVAHQFGAGPVKLMLLTFLMFDWLNLTSTNWQYVRPLIAKDLLLHLKQRLKSKYRLRG